MSKIGFDVLGKKKITPKPARATETTPKSFVINLRYSKKKDDGESLTLIAKDYKSALDEAFEEKVDKRQPIEVTIIDPNLGEILQFIKTGVSTATKLGAEFVIKGGHIAKQQTMAYVDRTWESAKVKKLIKQCYSSDLSVRAYARHQLKTEFSDIYDICDFSRT